eukprot:CAMPEP_0174841322 /NCGR_PEP_ID=MMETSP1114-20130205/9232_1 /TAXON_ID=312471 /ORGANISM="Neobodo designis, Strain CCAP 1951/1" /LENGTH=294 /DNA_ID=CAMNT_0016075503 /DNA_START=53 /DNA_END=937 /DNA_ORIENTATION=+
MRALAVASTVLVIVLATLAAPAAAWSKCSVCEWIVEKLISKGSCYAIGDACDVLPPPWDGVCKGIDDCCCDLIMKFIQDHVGDPAAICGKIHMCPGSMGDMMLLLAQQAKEHEQRQQQQQKAAEAGNGPLLPEKLASTVAGVTYDARFDFNRSYAATFFDDFTAHARRADFSDFEARGTRWVTKDNTETPELYEQVDGKCIQRHDFVNPPFVAERDFWVNATLEGREHRSIVGPVDKYTRLTSKGYFVGFFRPDTKLPAETWAFYKSSFRTIDVISGSQVGFNSSLVSPCTPSV